MAKYSNDFSYPVQVNPDNHSEFIGRLRDVPTYRKNRGGSKKVFINLAVKSTPNKKGTKSDFLPMSAFVSAEKTENGKTVLRDDSDLSVWNNITAGDLVHIIGHISADSYDKSNGEHRFNEPTINIDSVRRLSDSEEHERHVATAKIREAEKAQKAAEAQAQTGAPTDEEEA